jgi:hypothetical protein
MFTFALLQQKAREDPKNWRHLGFLLSQDFAPSKKGSLSPEKKLQQYHDYMLVLLEEVKMASEVRPKMWVNLGGTWRKMRLRISLSVVIRVVSHVIVILHQISISFEILHATPSNKLDH